MKTFEKNGKTWANLSDLHVWDKNPRGIKEERFKELKERINRHGQIKPMLVEPDGNTVGGNMRLRAFKELGVNEVWVSVVAPKDDKERVDIALTDNEEFGYYEQEALHELALSVGFTPVELQSYEVHLGNPVRLDLVNEWEPYEFRDLDGMPNVPDSGADDSEPEELGGNLDEAYSQKPGTVLYEPGESNHKPSDLYQENHKVDADIEQIQNPDIKKFLKLRVAALTEFNYSRIADYYAYQATPEEKRVFEKLALVLLDRDQLIENGFSALVSELIDSNYE